MNVPRPFLPSDRPQPEPSGLATLAWIARGKALAAKTNAADARDWMDANGAPTRAKAAVGAGTTTDSTLGSEQIRIGEWSASARSVSAFFTMWDAGAFIRVSMKSRVSMLTSAPTAGVVV